MLAIIFTRKVGASHTERPEAEPSCIVKGMWNRPFYCASEFEVAGCSLGRMESAPSFVVVGFATWRTLTTSTRESCELGSSGF